MRRRRAGFSLVEVMISASLLAGLLLILWGSFANVHKTRDAALARFDSIRATQAALRRMQREISMAFVTKVGEIPTNDEYRVTYQTAFIGENDRIDFTAFAHMRTLVGEVASEQAEISYYLASVRGRDGRLHQNLVRREQAPIDDDMQEGGYLYNLLQDVQSLRFDYWEPQSEMAGEAWEAQWDTTDSTISQLPPRVRITIEVMDPICQIALSDSDRRSCQRRRAPLLFTAQADIPLTLPIGFATSRVNLGALQAQAGIGNARQQIGSVLADESDEPDEDAFDGDSQQPENPR